jgi:hypothetical protein
VQDDVLEVGRWIKWISMNEGFVEKYVIWLEK